MATLTHHPDFTHRHNPNGTTNSICLKCFRTIASSSNEEDDLDAAEAAHKCGGFDLGYLLRPDDPDDQ